jgi:hypothetical protein
MKSCNCYLNWIPDDTVSYCANFFLDPEEQNKRIFNYTLDWQSFLNTSKKQFFELKKRTRFLSLNPFYSHQYLSSISYRGHVCSLLANPTAQLTLRLEKLKWSNLQTVETLSDIKRVEFISCVLFSIPALLNVEEVTLKDCMCSDYSCFSSIRKFSFYGDSADCLDFSQFLQLEELSIRTSHLLNYRGLKTDCLRKCTILHSLSLTDLKPFRNIPHLNLSGCVSLKDVQALQNCPIDHLDLSYCGLLDNVSGLGNVYSLDINHCKKVSDITALKKVQSLNISGCPQILDLSSLQECILSLTAREFTGTSLLSSPSQSFQQLTVLNLSFAKQLSDIRCLAHSPLEELDISHCHLISDITMLHSVKKLNISFVTKITDFSGLFQLEELIMETYLFRDDHTSFHIINGMETFKQLIKLTIGEIRTNINLLVQILNHSKHLQLLELIGSTINTTNLKNIRRLKLLDIAYLIYIPPELANSLRSLKVCRCEQLISLPRLPLIQKLIISFCSRLTSLIIEGPITTNVPQYPIYEVQITDCSHLTEVVVLRKIFALKLKDCSAFSTVVHSDSVTHFDVTEKDKKKIILH